LYDSFLHGAQRIAREEGVLALWKHGLAASVLREMSYSSLRMGLYPTVKALVTPNHADGSTQEAGLASKILAAALTGAIGSAVANPTDLVRPPAAPLHLHSTTCTLCAGEDQAAGGGWGCLSPDWPAHHRLAGRKGPPVPVSVGGFCEHLQTRWRPCIVPGRVSHHCAGSPADLWPAGQL